MGIFVRIIITVFGVTLLSSCTLPRGAALSSEILNEKDTENPTIDVVSVRRANLEALSKWPTTGWHGHYHWLAANRGPKGPVIRSGDRIDLVIWDSQENSLLTNPAEKTVSMTGLTVSPSGTIFVPYLNEVLVRGLSPAQARKNIQKALVSIVPDAQVQLSLTAGQENSVDLVTGVAKPGTYPLPSRNFSILSLISQGGGISTGLRHPLVRLIRAGKTYEVRSDVLFSNASKNTILRGNDKILVEEDKRYFTALGATGTEELVYFEKETITVLEALASIGGLSEKRANLQGVLILREYPAKAIRADGSGPKMRHVVFTFDLTTADGLFAAREFKINPKDTILATESPVPVVQSVFSLFGSALGLAGRL